jgi:hypothetical protein
MMLYPARISHATGRNDDHRAIQEIQLFGLINCLYIAKSFKSKWVFIRLHYFDALQVDDDYQRDRQLPFRDMDCGMIVNTTICTISPVAFEILPPAEPVREFYHFNDGHIPQFTSFDIFQPPRC